MSEWITCHHTPSYYRPKHLLLMLVLRIAPALIGNGTLALCATVLAWYGILSYGLAENLRDPLEFREAGQANVLGTCSTVLGRCGWIRRTGLLSQMLRVVGLQIQTRVSRKSNGVRSGFFVRVLSNSLCFSFSSELSSSLHIELSS